MGIGTDEVDVEVDNDGIDVDEDNDGDAGDFLMDRVLAKSSKSVRAV